MFPTRRILLIDDSAEDRETYRRLLTDANQKYEIDQTDCGDDAIERFRADSNQYHCVLLDYNLPDLDGLEFVTKLFDLELRNTPAVVMLTGVDNASVAVEAMKAGAREYLIKGEFSSTELQRAVDNAIEKNELMLELEQRREELARSNEELSQFAYSAAHDLQAPLRRTKAFCELLHQNYSGQFDEEGEEYLQFIVQCTEQMQSLVTGLLEYGRAGTSPRKFEFVDCSSVVAKVMENLGAQINECDATVTCDELPTAFGDHIQLVQVFQNLISNGVKYCRDHAPQVHISATAEGAFQRFEVKDNGIGIAPEHADQVFAVFRRLHSEDEFSGSGIGLATCRKIVERHRGRIWFESQPGEGSTFFFTIATSDS